MNYPGWEYEKFVCENMMFKSVMDSEDFERKFEVIDLFTDYFINTYTALCLVDGDAMRAWFKRCLTNPINLYDFVIDSKPWKEAINELDRVQNEAMTNFCRDARLDLNWKLLLIMARDEGLVRGKIIVAPDEKFLRQFADS